MLEHSKSLDGWSFVNIWHILLGAKSIDEITADSEDTYIQAHDELEKILEGKTLYGLVQPENVRNYNKYAEDLVEGSGSDKLSAYFSTGVSLIVDDEEEYLYYLSIILPDDTRCYIVVGYITNLEYISRRYVYYTEDSQVIEKLIEWAENYAIYEFDED